MGLFSFSKSSGAKLVDKKAEEKAAAVSAEELKRVKTEAMMKAVDNLHLPVKDVSILLNDDVVTVYGEAETQVAKELVLLTLGNNAGISSVDDRMSVVKPEPEATFYEVKSGDSLSKIAKEVYGDAKKYNAIFEANKPMLKDPDLIYPGQMLRIPTL
ncbi:MAG: peptidoglycan-binding protein LysM [Saprospiraceae bacterium]|nr:peptidoglycan-binding protein LysM [Candidatus Opimibacter iunctus]